MKVRLYFASLVGALVAVLSVGAVAAAPALAGECANEAIRTEQSSTYLPNCRAYEQVSPAAKDSGEPKAIEDGLLERSPFTPTAGARAAIDGNRMAWSSEYSLPGLVGQSSPGLDYLSTRGPRGWTTEATIPPQSPENGVACPRLIGVVGWSSNLSKGILADGGSQETGATTFFNQFGCGHDEPRLVEGEPEHFQNLFLRESTGPYQIVNVTPTDVPTPTPDREYQTYVEPNYLAGSAHLEHITFEDELPLTAEAEHLVELGEPQQKEFEAACQEEPKGRACWENHDELYVWSEGEQPAVRLVTILPTGEPVEGALGGLAGNAAREQRVTGIERPWLISGDRNAMSANGSRVFFEAEGHLYVRENAWAEESAAGECNEAERLAEPEKACTIQIDANQGGAGAGGGKWLGASEDGARVFFTDENDLTPTATAEPGKPDLYEYDFEATEGKRLRDLTEDPVEAADVQGVSGISKDGSYVYVVAKGKLTSGNDKVAGRSPEEAGPTQGAANLYALHSGAITFVATLAGGDVCDWECESLTARTVASGRYLAFNSTAELTGYANVDTVTERSDEEIFLYEAEGNRLACISCKPSGAPPSAGGAAIDRAASPTLGNITAAYYPQRNVTESGEVFFETSEELVPLDKNGVRDVYEYEHGALHLISSGMSTAPSYFMDATSSGSDVYFATAQKLERWDTDSAYDIYDARVGGGFPEPPAPAEPCASEGKCKPSAPTSTVLTAPSSTTLFEAPDNLTSKVRHNRNRQRGESRHLTRRQKLHRALRTCMRIYKHNRRARRRCTRHTRRHFSRQARSSRRRHSHRRRSHHHARLHSRSAHAGGSR